MWRDLAISCVLVAAILAVYWPVGGYPFVNLDDPGDVYENPHVRQGLTADGAAWAFTTWEHANWIPLTRLSHLAAVQVFGLRGGPHHLVNLGLHAANVLLLYLVLKALTAARWPGAMVAALFAVHPLHVESVAWVAERKDVLSTFFWLLALGAYAWYAARPGLGRYLAVFVLFVLGLMAKPMLMTLPVVLLLLDYWPLKRLDWPSAGRRVLEKVPLLAAAAAAGVVALLAQHRGGAMDYGEAVPPADRLANAAVAYVAYLVKTVWPGGLAVFYPYVLDRPAWEVAGAALLLVAVTALAAATARRRPYFIVGWLLYLATLAPVIGLVQIGAQAMADRYTYVPLVGVFIAVAWGARDLAAGWRHGRAVLAPAAAAVTVLCMVAASQQVRYWRDSRTLLEHALGVTTGNFLAHYNLGMVLLDEGRRDAAADHFAAALRSKPQYSAALDNLGTVRLAQGRADEGIRMLREAVRICPTDVLAHTNLAGALAERGDIDEALAHGREAVRLDPQRATAHNNLALALAAAGRRDAALAEFRQAEALALAQGRADLAAAIEARRRAYESGRPVRPGP